MPTPRWLAAAASLLLACGMGLHATSDTSGLAASLADLSNPMALARAMRGASSVRCARAGDIGMASPAAAADLIYRQWVPLRSRRAPHAGVIYEFRKPGEPAIYELVADDHVRLPHEVRVRTSQPGDTDRTPPEAGASGCSWVEAPEGVPGIALMVGR